MAVLIPPFRHGARVICAVIAFAWLTHPLEATAAPRGKPTQGREVFGPPMPPREQQGPPLPPAAQAVTPAAGAASPACLGDLLVAGHGVEPVPHPPASNSACVILDPVRLTGVSISGGIIALPDKPILSCAMARGFAEFVQLAVAPMATGYLHGAVTALGTGPGFDCRGQNRQAGAKISAHGKGMAVDVAWLALADKRRITIAGAQEPATARFIAGVRKAACGWFTTVLGPGADSFHVDHLHFDIELHGRSEAYRLCE